MHGAGWWRDSFRTHSSHPRCTPPRMWDLSDLAVDSSVQCFSRKQRCVATSLSPWGTQVFPFWKVSSCPQGSKEVNIQVSLQLLFLAVASPQPVPSCLHLNGLGPVPRSLHSCSAMRRGQRPPGRAVKCFVHSFRMIGK